jgi:hypothetical protein
MANVGCQAGNLRPFARLAAWRLSQPSWLTSFAAKENSAERLATPG